MKKLPDIKNYVIMNHDKYTTILIKNTHLSVGIAILLFLAYTFLVTDLLLILSFGVGYLDLFM